MAQSQFVFIKIFGNPVLLKKFHNQVRAELDRDSLEFLENAQKAPWRFSLFSIEAHLDGDFYEVHDHFHGDTLILQSEWVTKLQREGKRLFFTVLFSNPHCWQSYGIINYFKGFSPADINQFAALVDPRLYETGGTAAVAMSHPVPFMILYYYAERPVVMHGDVFLRLCCSEIQVDDPLAIVLPDNYYIGYAKTDSGDVLRFNLGEEGFFDRMDFFLDVGNRRAILSTQSEPTYRMAVERLGPYLNMPEKPNFEAGVNMLIALKEILGVEIPFSEYESLFTEEVTAEKKSELDKLNVVFAIVQDKINRGEPIDSKTIAEEHNLPLNLLEQVLSTIGNLDSAFPIELEYGIPGFSPPPPIIRQKIAGSFEYNELFSFNSGKAVQALFARSKADRRTFLHVQKEDPDTILEAFPETLDDIYDAFWETGDRTVMNYTMYLLRENGAESHAARDYAAEILRIFHQVLIADTEPSTISSFTRRYARFMYGLIIPAGLAKLDGLWDLQDIRRGSFTVRATDFMGAWLKW